ncbi:hypothetical protein HOG21_03930 [bacterium]|nr:hypothetical protein [bacterium]
MINKKAFSISSLVISGLLFSSENRVVSIAIESSFIPFSFGSKKLFLIVSIFQLNILSKSIDSSRLPSIEKTSL